MAWALAPRLDFAIGFCPWGPPALDGAELNRLDRMYFALARRRPAWMLAGFAPLASEMASRIERELEQPVVHRLAGKGHLCIEHWDDAFAAVCGAAAKAG